MLKQLTRELPQNKLREVAELADAHCHHEAIDTESLKQAAACGIKTIVVNGVDAVSNIKALALSDNRQVFAAIGLHPNNLQGMKESEIIYITRMIRENSDKIIAIGEIGLDFKFAIESGKQKRQIGVFESMLDLAVELDLPVSIHARKALKEVLDILSDRHLKRAHLHFFDGNTEIAKRIAALGYMVSIAPFEFEKSVKSITHIHVDNIMAETDAPSANARLIDLEKAVGIVARIKGMDYNKIATMLTNNTKRFFNTYRLNIMRKGP